MATPLVFPDELRGAKRPMMELKCSASNDNSEFVVYVPIPSNVSFDDGASYNETELGIIGGLTMAAARNVSTGAKTGGLAGAIAGAVKTGTGAFEKASMKDLIAGAIGAAPVDSEVKTGVGIGMGTTLNKNVTTEFTGMGVRSFTFAFKFIAKSQKESQIIANIVKGFRSNLYPVGNFISLKYPPTWTIRFLDGVTGDDISYLPKIFECYLKGLTTDFNPSANIWHGDNAPLETDITVAFIESRALTYDDIKLLDSKPYEKNDFLNSYQKLNSEGTLETLTSPSIGTTETPTNTETKVPVNNTGGDGFGATQNVYGIGASR